jgi:predicted permease
MPDWSEHLRPRLAALALTPAREAEILEELSQHLEQRYEELCGSGVSETDARRLTIEELLDHHALASEMRLLRQAHAPRPITPGAPGRFPLDALWLDLLGAARRLRTQPAFTTAAIVMLGIGIGATTAIFSVVNSVLIKPLPYPRADELVSIVHTVDGRDEAYFSDAIYLNYLEHGRTFQDVGIWNPYAGAATVTAHGDPEEVRSLVSNRGLLTTLGMRPPLGRAFSIADESPGAPDTVMLAHEYWQRRFGGDRSVVGQFLTINSRPHQIIGVTPPDFRFGGSVVNVTLTTWSPDVILLLRINVARPVPTFRLLGVARLKPDATLAQAHADVDRILAIWKASWASTPSPFSNTRYGSSLRPLKQDVVGNISTTLWVVMGTIAVVLVMACANLGNLLLVRADGRRKEFAIRAALGAHWTRLARALVVESVLLGIVGGILGVALAYAGVRLLVAAAPPNLPRLSEISIDTTVLAVAFAISLLGGLLFGLIPIVRYAGPRLAMGIGASRGIASLPRERRRSQQVLVAIQMALSLMLLVGSGLMIRSFQALRSVEPGFTEPHRLQTFAIAIPPLEIADPERVARTQHEIVEKIGAAPGVAAVAFTTRLPMDTSGRTSSVWRPEGKVQEDPPRSRQMRAVSPRLFETLGTPLIAGRDFTWADVHEGRCVAIISEGLAREWWGSADDALGKRVRQGDNGSWREIIGVSGNIYDAGVNQAPVATVFLPAQARSELAAVARRVSFIVRSERVGTETFLSRLREAVGAVNANLPLAQVRTLGDLYDQSLARTSFTLVMLAIAAGMALLLGIVGLYGVVAYAVSQRRREIGIRLALGAQPRAIQAMFMRRGLVLTSLGAAIGVCGAVASSRVMESLVFGISPLDPVTFVTMPVVLTAAALLASYLPARRALAVDPVETMRAE